jgi:hypothetical protein
VVCILQELVAFILRKAFLSETSGTSVLVFQQTVPFIVIAVRTSNSTNKIISPIEPNSRLSFNYTRG